MLVLSVVSRIIETEKQSRLLHDHQKRHSTEHEGRCFHCGSPRGHQKKDTVEQPFWTRFQEETSQASQGRDPSLVDKSLEQIFLDRYEAVIPLGRPQTPEDIGKMAAFLASEDARNVTGQCIHVDGGVILRD